MFGVVLCLWVLALLGSHGVRAIVIATHCAEGILVGADSLETTQSVLVDQLYAQKIYQVSPTAYVCISTLDARGFQLCQSLRVMAKSAMLIGKTLKVSELASYAQNLAGSMKINPHLLVVGDERTTQHSRHNIEEAGGDQDEQESCPQKIFEISPSGFMTEQDLAATGAGSNSALLLMDLKRTLDASESAKTSKGEGFDPFDRGGGDGDGRPRKASIRRTTKKIHKIIRALRASDANINGEVRMYLIPSSKMDYRGIVSIKE